MAGCCWPYGCSGTFWGVGCHAGRRYSGSVGQPGSGTLSVMMVGLTGSDPFACRGWFIAGCLVGGAVGSCWGDAAWTSQSPLDPRPQLGVPLECIGGDVPRVPVRSVALEVEERTEDRACCGFAAVRWVSGDGTVFVIRRHAVGCPVWSVR
jgi:hypothetical protein